MLKENSLVQKFNELSSIKKLSVCFGAVIVLFLIFMLAISLSSVDMENDSSHVKNLSAQYESYGFYVQRYHAWANSLYNNDSEPADLKEVLSEDATDAIKEMHDGGMSVDEITYALNEPVRIDYDQGIVDSPTLFDEDFVKGVVNN